MIIFLHDTKRIITAVEGTGDNLLPEDIADGYKDYFLTSIYQQDGEELNLIDSGQLLLGSYISELSLEDQKERLLDYWEAHNEPSTQLS